MATNDPSASYSTKRLRRDIGTRPPNTRDEEGDQPERGLFTATGPTLRDFQNQFVRLGPTGAALGSQLTGVGESRAAAPAPAAAPVVQRLAPSQVQRSDLRQPGSGLTRIVKTGDGAYTDAAGAQGQERYYDENGFRADVDSPTGITRNTTPAEYYRREQAAQLNLDDPTVRADVLQRGRRSLARAQERLDNTPDPNRLQFVTGEDGIPRVVDTSIFGQTTGGRGSRGLSRSSGQGAAIGGGIGAPDFGDLLNLQKFRYEMDRNQRQDAAAERRDNQSVREAERKALREDPAAYTQEFLGSLRGLTEEERLDRLNSDQGRLVLATITNGLRRQQQEGQGILGTIGGALGFRDRDPASLNLEDFEPGQFSDYRVRDDEFLSSGVDLNELGLQPEDFQTLMNLSAAYGNRRSK